MDLGEFTSVLKATLDKEPDALPRILGDLALAVYELSARVTKLENDNAEPRILVP